MALLDGLLALYRLNQDAASDASGNGRNLEVTGATYNTTTKKLGSAAGEFDGADDKMTSTATGFDGLTAITVAAWVYADTKGDYEHIIAKGNIANAIGEHSWGFIFMTGDSTAKLIWRVSNGTSEPLIESDASFPTGQWVHIIGTWDGTTIKMYIDNVLQTATDSLTGTMSDINDTTYPMRLGSSANVGQYFDGKLDEVAIWNREITAAERSQVFNSGTGIEIPYPTPTGGGGGGIWGLIR